MTTTPTRDVDALDNKPFDTLAAMMAVEQRLIEACRTLSAVTQQLPSAGPQPRVGLHPHFEELIALLSAYAEEIRYLGERYREGG